MVMFSMCSTIMLNMMFISLLVNKYVHNVLQQMEKSSVQPIVVRTLRRHNFFK